MVNNIDNLWALFYENDAYNIAGERVMGRQAAGNSLLKAYALSNYKEVGVYSRNKDTFKDFCDNFDKLLPKTHKKSISYIPWGNPSHLQKFGGLYFPAPDISRFVNQRYFFGDNNYSIIGVTHTTASEAAIGSLLDCYTSPLMPWDALICTSDSVKNSLDNLYNQYFEILNKRLGAKRKPNFETPVIPLGVHMEDFNFSNSDKLSSRRDLNIKDDDIVILFNNRNCPLVL